MNRTESPQLMADDDPLVVPREEFELFLSALTHEIRNRLNSIALEAADLAEQAGPPADAMRLQQYVQDCSAFLKKVRETLSPDDPRAEKMALAEFVKRLRERRMSSD
jgi:signal transduction histidine kinase